MWEPGKDRDFGAAGGFYRRDELSKAGGVLVENFTRQLRAVLDCYSASCSPNERLFAT